MSIKTWMISTGIRLRERSQTQKSTQLEILIKEFLEQIKLFRFEVGGMVGDCKEQGGISGKWKCSTS